MDKASLDYDRGMHDGYNGLPMASETNHDYLDGYTVGEKQDAEEQRLADEHEQEMLDEQARWEADHA